MAIIDASFHPLHAMFVAPIKAAGLIRVDAFETAVPPGEFISFPEDYSCHPSPEGEGDRGANWFCIRP
jgi:hypothetical protein